MQNPQMIAEITNAMGAHGAWKLKLKTSIATGTFDQDVQSVSCDDRCQFGRWLHGPSIEPDTKASVPYQVVRRLHAEFHQSAAKVLAHALKGERAEATTVLDGDYAQRSDKLSRALLKWKRELDGS